MRFTTFFSVDIAQGRCPLPLQGRFGNETVHSDVPSEVAVGLGRAGARWLHIVDLDGARTGERLNRDQLLEAIARAPCPVQAGGGLRGVDDVEEVLVAGANRAVLGARSLSDPGALRACARYGERVAVSLDVGAGAVGPVVGEGTPLLEAVRRFDEAGFRLFVHRAVDRDGTMRGPDIEGLRALAAITGTPIVASGGIASLADLRSVARLAPEGVVGAIVGRALYEQKFTVGEANLVADEAPGEHL